MGGTVISELILALDYQVKFPNHRLSSATGCWEVLNQKLAGSFMNHTPVFGF
jgi:hypothetical protein